MLDKCFKPYELWKYFKNKYAFVKWINLLLTTGLSNTWCSKVRPPTNNSTADVHLFIYTTADWTLRIMRRLKLMIVSPVMVKSYWFLMSFDVCSIHRNDRQLNCSKLVSRTTVCANDLVCVLKFYVNFTNCNYTLC